MAEANFFYLDPVPSSDSSIGGQPTTTQPSSSVNQTSNVTTRNDGSNLASRVESLEKLTSDIRENWAKKGQDANFANLDVKDRLTANFGKIGGFDVSSGVLSTNKLIIDSNNENIRSANYQTGTSGFKVSSELVEAENIIARGTLKGATFSYDQISAVGGQLMVANADTLAISMSSDDNSKLTTKGDTSFAVNDILVMRATAPNGIKEEWLSISAKNGNEYTVTRDLAGQFTSNQNPAWEPGTPVVKQGDTSSPNYGGWLRLIGEGTNAPYYSVFKRLSGTYNDYVEAARFGNLNGFLDYTTDEYGIAIGDATASLTYDTTNGLRTTFISTISASANIKYSANTERSRTGSVVKVKEFKVNYGGTVRIQAEFKSSTGGNPADAMHAYKNGVFVATIKSSPTTSYALYSYDMSIAAQDLVQIYYEGVNTVYIKNASIAYDKNYLKEATVNLD